MSRCKRHKRIVRIELHFQRRCSQVCRRCRGNPHVPNQLVTTQLELVETLKALCETITTTPRESWSLGTGQAHYELLEAYWDDFQHNHGNLWDVDPIESGYQRSAIYATVEGAYTMAKGQLYDIQQRLRSAGCYLPAASASHATPAVATQSYQRLPQINVPEFSGRREDWEGFRDLFTALIHQAAHLTDVERLYYLKTLVKGEAKGGSGVALQLMSSNYETAWALLLNRYDNRRLRGSWCTIIWWHCAQSSLYGMRPCARSRD
ncbi:unnamed protein product [Trichogramma brassicae]|uniref:Uncharacterized protein n=1 Tax=Trichogramma brassicae TaxID=86971 RepID=A0A6H5IIC5_9HYME|nr:unnamed protein product [Trichogramma brassicae]